MRCVDAIVSERCKRSTMSLSKEEKGLIVDKFLCFIRCDILGNYIPMFICLFSAPSSFSSSLHFRPLQGSQI